MSLLAHEDEEAAPATPPFRTVVLATLAVWALAYVALSASWLQLDMPQPPAWWAIRAAMCVFGAASCLGGHLLLTRGRIWTARERLAGRVVLALAGATAYAALNHYMFSWFWKSGPGSGRAGLLVDMVATGRVSLFFYLAWLGLDLALEYQAAASARAVSLARARELARIAEQRMLRYQINPHFLFNTLNSLHALIEEDRRPQASRLLLALSEYLRLTLDRDPADFVTLAEEIGQQTGYLSIEGVRFGDRLKVEVEAPEALGGCLVPAYILQPLVENAVKHGLDRSTSPVTIRLSAAQVGERLQLCVSDDAEPREAVPPRPGCGVGLGNIAQRLGAEYGHAASLTTGKVEPRGFRARIDMPLTLAS